MDTLKVHPKDQRDREGPYNQELKRHGLAVHNDRKLHDPTGLEQLTRGITNICGLRGPGGPVASPLGQ